MNVAEILLEDAESCKLMSLSIGVIFRSRRVVFFPEDPEIDEALSDSFFTSSPEMIQY